MGEREREKREVERLADGLMTGHVPRGPWTGVSSGERTLTPPHLSRGTLQRLGFKVPRSPCLFPNGGKVSLVFAARLRQQLPRR